MPNLKRWHSVMIRQHRLRSPLRGTPRRFALGRLGAVRTAGRRAGARDARGHGRLAGRAQFVHVGSVYAEPPGRIREQAPGGDQDRGRSAACPQARRGGERSDARRRCGVRGNRRAAIGRLVAPQALDLEHGACTEQPRWRPAPSRPTGPGRADARKPASAARKQRRPERQQLRCALGAPAGQPGDSAWEEQYVWPADQSRPAAAPHADATRHEATRDAQLA